MENGLFFTFFDFFRKKVLTNRKSADIIKPLERVLDPSEIWIIRRVFNVLNTYCPKNEHDLKLIASLEELIVKEFENN